MQANVLRHVGYRENSKQNVLDQGHGTGDPPIFSTEIEPLAQMTQLLTDKNALIGDFFGAAFEDNLSVAD